MDGRTHVKVVGLLILAILIGPTIAPVAVAQPMGSVALDVYLSRSDFKIEASKTGYSQNLTDVYLDAFLTADSRSILGSLNAWFMAENITEFTLNHNGEARFRAANNTAAFSQQTETTINFDINSTMLGDDEPGQLLPTEVYIGTSLDARTMGMNKSSLKLSLNLKLNVSNGLQYVIGFLKMPMFVGEADLAFWLNVTINSITDMEANRTKGSIVIYIDLETGSLMADDQIANMIKSYLEMSLSIGMIRDILESYGIVNADVQIDVDTMKTDRSVVYVKIQFEGNIAPMTTMQPIIEVPADAGLGDMASIIKTPTFTPVNATIEGYIQWSLEAESTRIQDNEYNVTIRGQLMGEYTGLEAAPGNGYLEAKVKIEDGYYEVYIKAESSYESPVTGLLAVKEIGYVLSALLPEETPVSINFNTKDVTILDTGSTPPREVDSITAIADDLPDALDTLAVVYDDIVIDTSDGILRIVADRKVALDYGAAALVDYIEAQAPGVEILLGAPSVTMQDFTIELDPNADMDAEAYVEIAAGSILGDKLSFEIMDRDNAAQMIGDSYTVAGVPVKAQGLINGVAEIELLIDPGVSNVKVLKVTEDGQVEVIEYVEVGPDSVTFETNSFSTFIPVVEKQAQQETETTTETTTEEAQETMTQTGETTTAETTTTTTETMTETTTETGTTTTPTMTGTETTQEQEEKEEMTEATPEYTMTQTPGETRTTRTLQTPTQTTQEEAEEAKEAPAQEEPAQQPAEEAPAPAEEAPAEEPQEGGINPALIGVAALIIIVIAAVVLLRR